MTRQEAWRKDKKTPFLKDPIMSQYCSTPMTHRDRMPYITLSASQNDIRNEPTYIPVAFHSDVYNALNCLVMFGFDQHTSAE